MLFREMAKERKAQGFDDVDDFAFETMQSEMSNHAERWTQLTLSEQDRYNLEARRYRAVFRDQLKQARSLLEAKIRDLKRECERKLGELGTPNHFGNCERLTEDDFDFISARLEAPAPNVIPEEAFHSAPKEPTVLEHNALEQLNAGLAPQGSPSEPRPWWDTHISSNRSFFHGAALYDADAESGVLYLILFGMQQPQTVWFLECREHHRILPNVLPRFGDDAASKPGSYREYTCLSPMRMLPDTDIGLNEFSNISVYHTLQFEGALVCSYHDPVPFEDFIRFHPRLRRPVRDPIRRTRRLADASVAKLLEAHPWLSPEDLQELKPQRVGR